MFDEDQVKMVAHEKPAYRESFSGHGCHLTLSLGCVCPALTTGLCEAAESAVNPSAWALGPYNRAAVPGQSLK